MNPIEQIRTEFANDRFATENGAVIDKVAEGYARCSLKLESRHKNAIGGVMGGVYFTLADFAFAVAANHEKMSVVSISTNISFLSPCKGDSVTAEAKMVKDGRTTCYYTVDVTDNTGRLVAAVTITGCKVA
ncbi:MAG: PaaI family thioesterase [Ruminococcus sp.]|nr:PaaI family thioesterase [Ruminococcus sp.]